MEIKNLRNQYIVEIQELNIITKSDSKGRALRDAFDKVSDYLRTKSIDPKIMGNHSYFQNIQIRMFKANQILTRLGFTIIGEEVTVQDMDVIECICASININNMTEFERHETDDKLTEVFSKYVMNPFNRALNMNSLIMKAEHIKKYSHLVDQAYMSLFRGEFISTIMILVPVVEGTLLSLYGFDSTSSKPNENQLLNKWSELEFKHNSKQIPHPFMFDEYIRAFLDIWENTIFNKHNTAKDNLFLNRHYITHLMGEGNFHTRNNAIKMVLLVDLIAYVMAISHGQHHRFTYDTKQDEYKRRVSYYQNLTLNMSQYKIYHTLMQEHFHFKMT